MSLRAFLRAIRGRGTAVPDAPVAARVVDVAGRARPPVRRRRPTVAVVGGGIFGAACAIELGRSCDVTLFERHPDLCTEASYFNQWRHHSGFHYPRSAETVEEIQAARADFASVFGPAVSVDVPSYYCTSRSGLEITRERYLAFCRENKLCFSIEDRPPPYVDPAQVSLCLRTDESVCRPEGILAVLARRFRENPRIRVVRGAEVVRGRLDPDGSKRLAWKKGGAERQGTFDYLVNATYANSNRVTRWFDFPLRPLRFDLLEMLVLELQIPKVSITVLDGPFTSLVSTGDDGVFMLSHIHESVIQSVITRDGLPPRWKGFPSNRESMLRHCARYLPVLREARYLESRFATRTVDARGEDFYGRPTVVTRHGFGCWSVLGGKIVTSVTNAREIALEIEDGA